MVTGKISIDLCCKINRKQKDRSLEIETKNRSIQEVDIELKFASDVVHLNSIGMQAGAMRFCSRLNAASNLMDQPPLKRGSLILEDRHGRRHAFEAELGVERFFTRRGIQNDLLVSGGQADQSGDDLLA